MTRHYLPLAMKLRLVVRGQYAVSPQLCRGCGVNGDARIADLTGQLYDPDGTHLADENARLRDLLVTLNKNLHEAQLESHTLRRSLDGARANVKRERERNVTILFPDHADHQ